VAGPYLSIDELGLYQCLLDDSRDELRSTCELGSLPTSAGLAVPRYR